MVQLSPDLIVDIAIGIFVGLLSTFVLIFISHKVLGSRIGWSHNIRHIWLEKSKRPSYSVKVRKRGTADLIETQVRCRLAVRDVLKNGGQLWNFYDIPTTFSQSLVWRNGARLVHLRLHEAKVYDFQQFKYFSEHLKIGRPDVGLRFEDFFTSYDEVYIQLFAIGHDRLTGIKKLYESPKYKFYQIRDGKWIPHKLDLDINFRSKYA